MIIHEIDKKLNMQGQIVLKLDHPLSEISKDYSLTSVARIRVKKNGGSIIINTPEISSESMREVSGKLTSFGSNVEGSTWSSVLDISSTTAYSFFRELIKTPSVVVDAIMLQCGDIHVFFRYHRNDHRSVSGIIAKHGVEIPNFQVKYLGESRGLVEEYRGISKQIPLQYVQIGSDVPPSAMDIKHDPVINIFGHNWVREMKYVEGNESHAIYYERQKLLEQNVKLTEISRDERIYEMTFSNPLMNTYFSESTEKSIAFLGVGHQLFGRGFSFYMVVPQMHLERFTGLVLGSFSTFRDWNMVLEYSVPADQL